MPFRRAVVIPTRCGQCKRNGGQVNFVDMYGIFNADNGLGVAFLRNRNGIRGNTAVFIPLLRRKCDNIILRILRLNRNRRIAARGAR